MKEWQKALEKNILNLLYYEYNCNTIHALEVMETIRLDTINYSKSSNVKFFDDNGKEFMVVFEKRENEDYTIYIKDENNSNKKSYHQNIINFIKLIKGPSPKEIDIDFNKYDTASDIIEEIFTNGNCARFAAILKYVFPQVDIYYIEDKIHYVVGYNNNFYDITGLVTDKYQNCRKEKVLLEDVLNKDEMFSYNFNLRGPML